MLKEGGREGGGESVDTERERGAKKTFDFLQHQPRTQRCACDSAKGEEEALWLSAMTVEDLAAQGTRTCRLVRNGSHNVVCKT